VGKKEKLLEKAKNNSQGLRFSDTNLNRE